MSGKGTPATTALAAAAIAHVTHEYVHDPNVASYGTEAADALGVDAGRVFKTLLVTIERSGRLELAVGVVPVDAKLDLRAFAMSLGAKKAEMADPAVAERSSGYVVGGISPIGQRRLLATVVDESAIVFSTIFVSGGRRGLDIEIAPDDLVTVVHGTYAPIAKRT